MITLLSPCRGSSSDCKRLEWSMCCEDRRTLALMVTWLADTIVASCDENQGPDDRCSPSIILVRLSARLNVI